MAGWQPLHDLPGTLNPAIAQLHHAAQFVAMVGNSYLPKLPDDSQNNLSWNSNLRRLEGRRIESASLRTSLDVIRFELLVETGPEVHHVPLDGKTRGAVRDELTIHLKSSGLDGAAFKPITQFSIPPHPIADGAAFQKPDHEALVSWSCWRSNAQRILEAVASEFSASSAIRVWPHHFDTGLYIPVQQAADGKDIQSLGLGLAIPDGDVPEPYFYLNHWSQEPPAYPAADPSIRWGYWHSDGWKGFLLPASAIFLRPDTEQENMVREFFREGVATTLHLLGK